MKHSKKNSKVKGQKSKVVIFLGPPGSGKGTQAKLLAKKYRLEYFGSGMALRERQKVNDFTGKKIGEVMERGEWMPESVICRLWMNKLEEFKNKRFNGFIYDGGPRRRLEAEIFDVALEWYEWQDVKVIFIKISKKESLHRLTKRRQCKRCGRIIPWLGEFKKLQKCDRCGGELIIRADDTIGAIKKRLEEFEKETMPTINYYKKQDRVIEINGEQPIEDVFKDVLKALQAA